MSTKKEKLKKSEGKQYYTISKLKKAQGKEKGKTHLWKSYKEIKYLISIWEKKKSPGVEW